MNPSSRIYIAGHTGLAGSAIQRRLIEEGYTDIITRAHAELDLTRQILVDSFFNSMRPDVVIIAAALVGGIAANSRRRADFIRENLLIQTHIIDSAYRHGVERLLFLGSSCIYPRACPQPMKEEYLLTGPLEPTNEPYAIAKIAGVKMCEAYNRQYGTKYLAVMPTNLYGPGDHYDYEDSHVLPGLLRRFHEAKLAEAPEIVVWGTGSPRREFMHADDLAEACVFLLEGPECELTNIGTGSDVTIKELAELIAKTVGYEGKIIFDASRPDGPPRKLLDVSKLSTMGWQAKIDLADGLQSTYAAYISTH